MITDILDMGKQTQLQAQVVVIGSGIAGADHHHLACHGREVVLVESGRQQFDPAIQVFGTDNVYVAGSAVFPTGPKPLPPLQFWLWFAAWVASRANDACGSG